MPSATHNPSPAAPEEGQLSASRAGKGLAALNRAIARGERVTPREFVEATQKLLWANVNGAQDVLAGVAFARRQIAFSLTDAKAAEAPAEYMDLATAWQMLDGCENFLECITHTPAHVFTGEHEAIN